MKSLICNLDDTRETMEAALTETEDFTNRCMLSKKRCLHMRLLAEELLGMTSGLLKLHDGTFWIDENDGHYEIHLTAKAEASLNAQEKLMGASFSGKNEMYKGVSGKICQAMEWLLHPGQAVGAPPTGICSSNMMHAPDPSYLEWSLERYRQSVSKEEKVQAWDELEKSVLGNLADDVHVGVKSNRVEIIINKTFQIQKVYIQ